MGVGGQKTLGEAALIADAVLPLPEVVLLGAFAEVGVDFLTFGGQPHDLIVSEPSQKGGLTGAAVSVFDNDWSDINTNWLAVHTSVTKESRISAHVIDLLNASANSTQFAHFGE